MSINILMPALSPTMTEGTLARWLKNEGDKIKSGDVIAEIETDKATMEVEAVDEGVLEKNGWADEAALKAIDAEVKRIVADAAEFARTSPEPDPSELYTDVYIQA